MLCLILLNLVVTIVGYEKQEGAFSSCFAKSFQLIVFPDFPLVWGLRCTSFPPALDGSIIRCSTRGHNAYGRGIVAGGMCISKKLEGGSD